MQLVFNTADAQNAPSPLMFHASQSGHLTLDQGEGGGNPFASALIELLSRSKLYFQEFPTQLASLTFLKSGGFQRADVPSGTGLTSWAIKPRAIVEKRVAMVIVFSDYSSSGGAQSLPGAMRDANRIASTLANAGFETEKFIDPEYSNMQTILQAFSVRSSTANVAIIYTTGHGVEVEGRIFLLPGNYPIAKQNGALESNAIQLSRIATAARATFANLVFYAGCRNNPFGKEE